MPRTRLFLGRREDLGADCAACFGLCCVALEFSRSSDFAVSKPAGEPCVNLAADDSCTIHSRLRTSGYRGCTVFDCFGAGQKVSQQTFSGETWRANPSVRGEMFAAFPVMRRLHELLWYLDCALSISTNADLTLAISSQFDHVRQLTNSTPADLKTVDTDALYDEARPTLVAASAERRSGYAQAARRIAPGADLAGADLRAVNLRGANLRGAILIGADLTGADLGDCDVLGADVRDASLGGADLSSALFLTQAQVSSARGDHRTTLPSGFVRPAHWVVGGVG